VRTDPARSLVRTVNWRLIADRGSERCELLQEADGWTLAGTVEAFLDGPIRVTYAVRCSPEWMTRGVVVNEIEQDEERSFELAVGPDGRWRLDGELRPDLDRCVDVDLGMTPSTNTLPIRRLGLEVGASAEILAAWIRFPQLDVVPAAQRYTHMAENQYLYQSDTFRAELDVDDLGLVITYAGVWERDAATD
jgi:hypothetical protein